MSAPILYNDVHLKLAISEFLEASALYTYDLSEPAFAKKAREIGIAQLFDRSKSSGQYLYDNYLVNMGSRADFFIERRYYVSADGFVLENTEVSLRALWKSICIIRADLECLWRHMHNTRTPIESAMPALKKKAATIESAADAAAINAHDSLQPDFWTKPARCLPPMLCAMQEAAA